MGAIKSDNPLDIDIFKQKSTLFNLNNKVNSFIGTHLSLQPKERARALTEIQQTIAGIKKFIDTFPISTVNNSGTRFAFENLKASFGTLCQRWVVFESRL